MTHPIYDTYKPPGFHTVSAYLTTNDAPPLIEFLKTAFHAVELQRTVSPEGVIRNCIMQIGDSCYMVGRGVIRNCIMQIGDSCYMVGRSFTGEPMPGQLYLYCADPDALHARAVQHGAESVMKVEDQTYGDRQGGVKDCAGNHWWISKRLLEEPYSSK